MKRKIITTADGSKTIHFPEWNESYHSKHGAIQEARHVYIQSGFAFWYNENSIKTISIFEVGFGTGLNAMLSYLYGREKLVHINYHSLEKYPIEKSTLNELNYQDYFSEHAEIFNKFHSSPWDLQVEIDSNFSLTKIKSDLKTFQSQPLFDLIYFDAFGPRVQPELWEKCILQQMYNALKPNGVWVTYSCKGQVRRDLQDVGFKVEKIPGPPGKREMLRAVKI